MSRFELAAPAKIGGGTIGSIEQGQRAPRTELAERLDAILDTQGTLAVSVEQVPAPEKSPAFARTSWRASTRRSGDADDSAVRDAGRARAAADGGVRSRDLRSPLPARGRGGGTGAGRGTDGTAPGLGPHASARAGLRPGPSPPTTGSRSPGIPRDQLVGPRGHAKWFTSGYRGDSGGARLEVAYGWRKSTYRSDSGGNGVEVAAHPAAVRIRGSKVTAGPAVTVDRATRTVFPGSVA